MNFFISYLYRNAIFPQWIIFSRWQPIRFNRPISNSSDGSNVAINKFSFGRITRFFAWMQGCAADGAITKKCETPVALLSDSVDAP